MSKLTLGTYFHKPTIDSVAETACGVQTDEKDSLYFGYLDSNLYFLTRNVSIDMCATRVAGLCTACEPQYYLNSTSLPNKCIRLDQFPPLHGADNSTFVMRQCGVAFCSECLFDYSACTRCDSVGPRYLYNN